MNGQGFLPRFLFTAPDVINRVYNTPERMNNYSDSDPRLLKFWDRCRDLLDPLPNDEASFKRRTEEGRGRLTLIANEVARLTAQVLIEYTVASKKIRDNKGQAQAAADGQQQLQRLIGPLFVRDTPWPQMQHLARYLKAITLRLDKCRSDPTRDAQRMAEIRAQEQRYWRLVAERKGVTDERMLEFRWLLEELRVSLFAQELRTPQPVSVKRLDKAWAQLN